MKKIFVGLLLVGFIIGCGGSDNPSDSTTMTTASVQVQIDEVNTAMMKALGTSGDISYVTVDIIQYNTYLYQNSQLQKADGVYSGTFVDLPVSVSLTFIGHAYDINDIEIFTGSESYSMTGSGDSVLIRLSPVDDGVPVSFPKILQIERPSEVVALGNFDINLYIQATSGDDLSFSFEGEADSGSFTPASGSFTMSANVDILSVVYTAPDTLGVNTFQVTITNSSGQSVAIDFDIEVVEVGDAELSALFNPVILAVNSKRINNSIEWKAVVDDDGDASELVYQWSFDGGLAFDDASANPTNMQNYSPDVSGKISLTVVDEGGIGGSTQITFTLPLDMYPDNSIIEPGAQTTISYGCIVDQVYDLPQSGSYTINPSMDLIPLCNGYVIIGDSTLSQVYIMDIRTGNNIKSYPVSGAPLDMALDDEKGILYVTQSSSNSITKINLNTDNISQISTGVVPLYLAVGNNDILFASLDDSISWPNQEIAVIDSSTETVLDTLSGDFGPLLAYDKPGNQLISGVMGSSPSSLYRCSFDPSSNTLTFVQELWDAGGNGQDLAISRDGDHIAFPCGGGNGSGYTIFDFSSNDLETTFGEWNTGAYPTSADFSKYTHKILATERDNLLIFDADSHALLESYPIPTTGCSYSDLSRVRFSPGGRIAYATLICGFENDGGMLVWQVIEQ